MTTPVNIADLQASLISLQKDPLVERINAELVPGERLGESRLNVGVTERAARAVVSAANDRSASIGGVGGRSGWRVSRAGGQRRLPRRAFRNQRRRRRQRALLRRAVPMPGGVKLQLAASRARRRHHRGAVQGDRHLEPHRSSGGRRRRRSFVDDGQHRGFPHRSSSSISAARAHFSARRSRSRRATSTARPSAARLRSARSGRATSARARSSRAARSSSASTC